MVLISQGRSFLGAIEPQKALQLGRRRQTKAGQNPTNLCNRVRAGYDSRDMLIYVMAASTSQKVPCLQCGVLILESTALRTKGLCMPCKSGYRKAIDEGARRNREIRDYDHTDPFRRPWLSLVEKVDSSSAGFDGLTENEKLYWAVGLLELEVYNGGLEQYFFNSSGSYYDYAERGLMALGAVETLNLLRGAKAVLFPATPVPQDTKNRRDAVRDIPARWSSRLDALDKKYWGDPDGLVSRLQTFARERGLIP